MSPTNPFYDAQGRHEQSGTILAISDNPDETPSDDNKKAGVTSIRDIFDDYLVSSSGQVFYHVHWERVDKKYDNISGEPANKLPAWASDDTLASGYTNQDATIEQPRYNNPVAKDSR